jgi:hypothetical protein
VPALGAIFDVRPAQLIPDGHARILLFTASRAPEFLMVLLQARTLHQIRS